ncbi:hypothetical protein HPB47_010452, partial [Ixodes persulcatus]
TVRWLHSREREARLAIVTEISEESLLNLLTMTLTISAEDNDFVRLLYETKVKKYASHRALVYCGGATPAEASSAGVASAVHWCSEISILNGAARTKSKATVLDQVFGPAWLMYGHSFAVESEHDQAMAAYFKALQLMKGCHLPFLYIGLEYGLTNNTKLAERFFNQALAIAPNDPFVLHELGVVAFQNQEYANAKRFFENALGVLQTDSSAVLSQKWEPLLNNLGHTCRKLRKYNKALEYHQQALVLSPKNASTLSAIGFVHSLMCHWSEAVDYFHKALGLQRDDTFSTTMLSQVIEHLMNELPPYQ